MGSFRCLSRDRNSRVRRSSFLRQDGRAQTTSAERKGNRNIMFEHWVSTLSTLVGIPVTVMTAIVMFNELRNRSRRKDAVANDRELDELNGDDGNGVESEVVERAESGVDLKQPHKLATYSLNGSGCFGKGRLVLEVVSQYVKRHPDVTYAELDSVFPKSLRGVKREGTFWGCINRKVDADRLLAETGRPRHFLKDDEVILLKDGSQVVVSSQWGSGNINLFIGQARKLGFDIQVR